MNIEGLIRMNAKELAIRYSQLTGQDWKEKAVIKGLHQHKTGKKKDLLNYKKEI